MNRISFFTPVSYANKDSFFSERLLEGVDDYLFWGGKKARVIPISGDRVYLVDEKTPLLKNVIKIASYVIFVLPIIAFVTKCILRSTHSFRVLDQDMLQQTQGLLRGAIAHQAFALQKSEPAKLMQGLLRESTVCRAFKREQQAAITIQCAYRRHRAQEVEEQAAITIQCAYRRHQAQATLRGLQAKKVEQARAASEIQSMLRVKQVRVETHGLYDELLLRKSAVTDGYGEYIVFRSPTQSDAPLSQETFDAAYAVIQKYVHNPKVVTDNRADIIRKEIKIIDPFLEICFVPRTLYDLFFISAGIKEEMKAKQFCALQYHPQESFESVCEGWREHLDKTTADKLVQSKISTCWHICRFTEEKPFDLADKPLQLLAWRLNNLIVKKLRPKGFFNGLQLAQFSEKRIAFLKKHNTIFGDLFQKNAIDGRCGVKGTSLNFGLNHENYGRYSCFPMGIKDLKAAQTVRNAISLECNSVAQNAFILYRAGDFIIDKALDERFVEHISLSYGTSLFAGALYDATATVFYYTVTKKRDTYAIVVPYKDYRTSPYYVPFANAIGQACSSGEFFHPRSKIPNNTEHVSGIWITDEKRPEGLIRSKSVSEFTRDLNQYQAQLRPLST